MLHYYKTRLCAISWLITKIIMRCTVSETKKKYNLVIGGSSFPHKDINKATWVAPNQRTFNQTNHIVISKKWRRSLLDVRNYRGADVAIDHHLVVAQLILKLAANKLSDQRVTRKKFNTDKFNYGETRQKFQDELKKSLDQERINDHTHL